MTGVAFDTLQRKRNLQLLIKKWEHNPVGFSAAGMSARFFRLPESGENGPSPFRAPRHGILCYRMTKNRGGSRRKPDE
jgi:hypothetical protein